MADIDSIYRALVEGTADDTSLPSVARPLLRLALERARSPAVHERIGALRVASALGRTHGLAVTRELLHDADPRVRRYAFNQAVAARRAGIVLLRLSADGNDPELVAEALRLLGVVMDRGSSSLARRLTEHPEPAVRAAAARLVGLVAGPAARVQIARLADDPDPAVRQAASEALERLAGTVNPGRPGQWWDDDDDDGLPSPPVPDEEALAAEDAAAAVAEDAAPERAAPAPPNDADGAATSEAPAPPVAAQPPVTEPSAPEVPEETALVPVEPEPDDDRPLPADGEGIPLPSRLPTEARALLRLLARVGDADQAPVLAGLEPLREEVVLLLARHRPGGDEALGRGLGLAARLMGASTWLTRLRPLLADPSPVVRVAAVEAFGAQGSGSSVPQMSRLLEDDEPRVRRAAVEAIDALCARTSLERARWLRPRLTDADADVSAAARRALGIPDPPPDEAADAAAGDAP